ncbi:MAG: hypothetical protein ACW98I_00480 [Candidatus Hodarchaeales archaeon]
MSDDKIKLLRTIFQLLEINELPESMVTRRITITNNFERNLQAFYQPDFVRLIAEVLEKGKSFDHSAITSSLIYTYINDSKELWEAAFEISEKIEPIGEFSEREEGSEYKEIIDRNKYSADAPRESDFLSELLTGLLNTNYISYSSFEKEILGLLGGKENSPDTELIQEAVKALAGSLYKEDPETSFRFIFEEYFQNAQVYENLGLRFNFPKLDGGLGKVSRFIEIVEFTNLNI